MEKTISPTGDRLCNESKGKSKIKTIWNPYPEKRPILADEAYRVKLSGDSNEIVFGIWDGKEFHIPCMTGILNDIGEVIAWASL